MFLIDTDVLSMLRRRERNPAVARWMAKQRTADLHLSVVSVGEVERGIAQQRRLNPTFAAALAAWLDGMVTLYSGRILPADMQIARRWGRRDPASDVERLVEILQSTSSEDRQ